MVAGTIRSTIVPGKVTLARTQSDSAGDGRRATDCSTRPRSRCPLAGRLSQLTSAIGPASARCRAARPRTSRPGTVRGGAVRRQVAAQLVVEQQPPGGRVEPVALLGHGQRDHPDPPGRRAARPPRPGRRPRAAPRPAPRSPGWCCPAARAWSRCRARPAPRARRRTSAERGATPTMPQSPPAAAIASSV